MSTNVLWVGTAWPEIVRLVRLTNIFAKKQLTVQHCLD